MEDREIISITKKLSSVQTETRIQGFQEVKEFLLSSRGHEATLLDMQILWKGLYYNMYMCDKVKHQEKVSREYGRLFSDKVQEKQVVKFYEAFWSIMAREWIHIDQWRTDKFYFMIRIIMREVFIVLKRTFSCYREITESYIEMMTRLTLSGTSNLSMGLQYHVCDIYLDEIESAFAPELSGDKVIKDEILSLIKLLLVPFEELLKKKTLKSLKKKVLDTVLNDKRLFQWGIKSV